MEAVIRWAIRNSPAMNTLTLTVLLLGGVSFALMHREVYPNFDLEAILITVPYPGATPAEVEEGICQKLEEAVRSISGIKRQTTVAREGAGLMALLLESSVSDVDKVLSEVRAEIDRIPSFPDSAEDPEIRQMTLRTPAIRVAVLGPDEETPEASLELREVAERVREDMLQLPAVSQANLINVRNYQIDVEIPEVALRRYGLSLRQVAQTVRRENIELPGGKITTDSQDVLLRGRNKRVTGEDIARIPVVTTPGGVVLTLGDLGTVRDEFDDTQAGNWVNGRPAAVISVDRTSSEDLLAITGQVKSYVAKQNERMPDGFELAVWQDTSLDVRDRIQLLAVNGLQGLILVFIVLTLFLDLKLAFWVALGIPVSLLGAGMVLYAADQTLNMLSMFAFLLVLGIVVDDGIVIGENIFERHQRGESLVHAAVHGTVEVLPSIVASVSTTIMAFLPLFFVTGVLGKFISVLPLAVVATLVVSLVEATLVMPCHIAHPDNLLFRIFGVVFYSVRSLAQLVKKLNGGVTRLTMITIDRLYIPLLRVSLANTAIVLSLCAALLILTLGLIRSGITPWVLFPKLDSKLIEAKVTLADGTPFSITDGVTRDLELALEAVNRRFETPVLALVYRAVGELTAPGVFGPETPFAGAHLGAVYAELLDPSLRNVTSEDVLRAWREEVGVIPVAEQLTFASEAVAPGGASVEFKLLAPASQARQLEEAAERCKSRLAEYPGVFDIRDDLAPGKWECQLRVKDSAIATGVTAADLAETVRASYYGEEVMRLQRGRHEVKLMVRYPREQRRSLGDFDEIRIRGADGMERPLTELAEIRVERGYAEINRTEQLRSITISADVDESQGNAFQIAQDLQSRFTPGLLEQFPGIRIRWEGQKEVMEESVQSLMRGFLLAVFGIFCLLTLEFRSYFQPIMIVLIIPFGLIGAVWGHGLLGLPLTIFSIFGMVALAGVVVNDAIVLVDFINVRVRAGVPLTDALFDAGRSRFRPILLTSLTTVAGLFPILLETSFQAQALIPMAASLSFGLIVSTATTLLVIPVSYQVYASLGGLPAVHTADHS